MERTLIGLCVWLHVVLQIAFAQPAESSARQLYARAAAAIASEDSKAAIEPLEQLIAESKSSALSEIAAVHLAECFVHNARCEDAAKLLNEWSDRITPETPALKIDPNLLAHHARVWLHAACGIKNDNVAIETLVALCGRLESLPAAEELVITQRSARQELAKRYVVTHQVDAAKAQLAQVCESACDAEEELIVLELLQLQRENQPSAVELKLIELANHQPLTRRTAEARMLLAITALRASKLDEATTLLAPLDDRFEIARNMNVHLFEVNFDCRYRLIASELALANGNAERAVTILSSTDELSELIDSQKIAIKFALAEAFTRAQQPSQALEELQWLREAAQSMSPMPEWAATIELRRAELMFTEKMYDKLAEVADDAKAKFADFEKLDEFDYLLARAAILQVDFERARIHLTKIINLDLKLATGRENAVARALWMLGEIDFLEQKYDSAIVAYSKAMQQPDQQPWQNLALLQTGKCLELLNRGTDALAAYERVVAETQDEKLRAEAISRLNEVKRTAANSKAPLRR